MGLFNQNFLKQPKSEITKDTPPKLGLALFFSVFFNEFWALVRLNLLFLLFCIPIVTIPAALTAMSKITLLMLRDKNVYLWTDFTKCFKEEFKKSLLIGVLLFVLIALSVLGLYFYDSVIGGFGGVLIKGVEIALLGVAFLAGSYIFPMIAITYLDIRIILKNALILTVLRLPLNLLALVLCALLILLCYIFLPLSLIIVVFLLFSLMNLITTFCAYSGLKKYILKEEDSD